MKKLLVGLVLALTIPLAFAQQAFVEGRDYDRVAAEIPQEGDKINVTEVFWYGCPHCFRFEPYANRFKASLPDDVDFVQQPSVLNPRWAEHARTYYAIEMMGIKDSFHEAFFNALHLQRERLFDVDAIAAFVADQGHDAAKFKELYFSFPVETMLRKNMKKEQRYGHRGVPAVIVNGKYLVSASKAGSNERMIEIMNFLIDQERNS